jgi:hypothetical protein
VYVRKKENKKERRKSEERKGRERVITRKGERERVITRKGEKHETGNKSFKFKQNFLNEKCYLQKFLF